ncbi:hypothetical protein GCM10011578_061670 [Streptomyces fuscichromogenes]|uniref:Uncharacterized protein n=1 Tax=Streptomyces fuscichromogenes TaxID=1324013 RepID=A0A917XIH6_9ACTN|nr:hypothetical protein GCM10011578_061670 [Streptomyces fuscichromogenes]
MGPDGPNEVDGSCCHVQPDVATNTIAANTGEELLAAQVRHDIAHAQRLKQEGVFS